MLKFVHSLRIKEVQFSLSAPLVLASYLEFTMRSLGRPTEISIAMTLDHFFGNDTESNPAKATRGAGKVLIDNGLIETDGFKDLCSGVRSDRRNSHFGHDFQNALACSFRKVHVRLTRTDSFEESVRNHVIDRVQCKIRVNSCCSKSDEQRNMMNFSSISGLNDETHLSPRLFFH